MSRRAEWPEIYPASDVRIAENIAEKVLDAGVGFAILYSATLQNRWFVRGGGCLYGSVLYLWLAVYRGAE